MNAYRAAGELIERCDALLAQDDPTIPIAATAIKPARRWTFPGHSFARQITDYLHGTGELAADERMVWRPDPTAR